MKYFVTTKHANASITGRMPYTAAEVLAFIERTKSDVAKVVVLDKNGKRFTIEQLKKEAGS